MRTRRWLIGAAWMIAATPLIAYKQSSHEQMTSLAIERCVFDEPSLAARVGLKYPVDSGFQLLLNPRGLRTIKELISDGAIFEDDGARSLNHFFDPLTGQGLNLPVLGGRASPAWALEYLDEYIGQNSSLRDAKSYFLNSLTQSASSYRKQQLGLAFQTLGQVVHHLQDMAQPQHVRADQHCDDRICRPAHAYNPSLYEEQTKDIDLSIVAPGSYPLPVDQGDAEFRSPQFFWSNVDRTGMADYTNRGFVSAGRNFTGSTTAIGAAAGYPQPNGSGATISTVNGRQLRDITGCVSSLPASVRDDDQMAFIGTNVDDSLLSSTAFNDKTSTFSIFDAALAARGAAAVFSLNSYNFCAVRAFLIPRAVAYSAAMLKYFFRGALELTAPSESIFAIADQSAPSTANFVKLRVHVRNVSYDAGADGAGKIGAGTIKAIARFNANNCFRSDLSGEWGEGPDRPPYYVDDRGCRSPAIPDDAVAVSSIQSVSDGEIDGTGRTYTFDFSANPIPVRALDLRLHVLFEGNVGSDPTGFAIGTVDLREPTFITFGNHLDYIAYYKTDGSFSQAIHDPFREGRKITLDLWFNPSLATSVASTNVLYPGNYTRVAVLTAAVDLPYQIRYRFADDSLSETPGLITQDFVARGSLNQFNQDNGVDHDPAYVRLRRTTTSDWTYHGNVDGLSIFWNFAAACETSGCTPVDRTPGEIVRRLPPFEQAAPQKMSISF